MLYLLRMLSLIASAWNTAL